MKVDAHPLIVHISFKLAKDLWSMPRQSAPLIVFMIKQHVLHYEALASISYVLQFAFLSNKLGIVRSGDMICNTAATCKSTLLKCRSHAVLSEQDFSGGEGFVTSIRLKICM